MATAKNPPSVTQAPIHTPRAKPPALPRIAEPGAMAAARRIFNASAWTPHLAIMEINNIRTLNLDPALASYKTEMLEYLGTLPEPKQ